MRYFAQMLPNVGLAVRMIREVGLERLYFHGKNNLLHNLFNPSQDNTSPIIPNTYYIEPTYACNRKCDGCQWYFRNDGTVLDERIAHHVFDTAEGTGANYIALIGGEPLLKPVRDITLGVSEDHPNVSVVLCTNGDFIDGTVGDRIAKAVNIVPFVSVDGNVRSHDLRRGSGSYDKAMEAMGILRKSDVMFGYSTTLTAQNWVEVTSFGFVDEMIRRGCLVSSYYLYLSNDREDGLRPTPEQSALAMYRLGKIAMERPIYILSTSFGRLGGRVKAGKRLMGMSIDPHGGVRTERGGQPIGQITHGNTLSDIIFDPKTQTILSDKVAGCADAPSDSGRRDVQQTTYELLNCLDRV